MSSPIYDQNSTVSLSYKIHTQSPLRNPPLDPKEHALIAVVVLVPIISALLLCIISYCIYRYRKRRAQQNIEIPMGQHIVFVPTIFGNSDHNPIIYEELPPAYDRLSEIKKDLPSKINTPEHLQSSSSIKNENIVKEITPSTSYSNNIDKN